MHRIRTHQRRARLAPVSFPRAPRPATPCARLNVQPGGTLTIDADVSDITFHLRRESGHRGSGSSGLRRRRQGARDRVLSGWQRRRSAEPTITAAHVRLAHLAHYNVTVPSTYNVHLGTSGGDIHVLHGEAIKMSGGNLQPGNIQGNVDARTFGGDEAGIVHRQAEPRPRAATSRRVTSAVR